MGGKPFEGVIIAERDKDEVNTLFNVEVDQCGFSNIFQNVKNIIVKLRIYISSGDKDVSHGIKMCAQKGEGNGNKMY